MYHGRFAPTPSGPLHFGSLVAALGSYLDAKKSGGTWHVRIDDIDPPRVAKGAADSILRCLEHFGLYWDGPVVRQSQRYNGYHSAMHALSRDRLIYSCACSRKEVSEAGTAGIDGPVYPGTCRIDGGEKRVARALRVIVPDNPIVFDDRLQGVIAQNLARVIGDFVVYRADHVYAYHLACVVDDAEQGITDIVRGADLVDSTPRQIYLQRALGFVTPRYLHLPIVLNAAGKKLAKQTRAPDVSTLALIPTLRDALLFLGQEIADEATFSSTHELLDYAVRGWNPAGIPPRQAPMSNCLHSA